MLGDVTLRAHDVSWFLWGVGIAVPVAAVAAVVFLIVSMGSRRDEHEWDARFRDARFRDGRPTDRTR